MNRFSGPRQNTYRNTDKITGIMAFSPLENTDFDIRHQSSYAPFDPKIHEVEIKRQAKHKWFVK